MLNLETNNEERHQQFGYRLKKMSELFLKELEQVKSAGKPSMSFWLVKIKFLSILQTAHFKPFIHEAIGALTTEIIDLNPEDKENIEKIMPLVNQLLEFFGVNGQCRFCLINQEVPDYQWRHQRNFVSQRMKEASYLAPLSQGQA